jgi:hypothetical protein
MYPKHHHLATEAIPQAISLLSGWLKKRLTPEPFNWFDTELRTLQSQPEQARWFKALGLTPRKLGKADLQPTDIELHVLHNFAKDLTPPIGALTRRRAFVLPWPFIKPTTPVLPTKFPCW